eukprot:scaffold13306_cov234-Alexandrium_tamarense.AAC.4
MLGCAAVVDVIVHEMQTMSTRILETIKPLEREHNRHIAKIVAAETLGGILEWMLEGWYFGERDTKWDTKKKLANQRLATTVQRVYRGHLGRKVAKMRAFQLQSAHSADILMNACAPAIGKVWRGY